jgi:glucuronokinase
MTIVTRAHARAGLLGNPSDGYFGKIIAISVKNFAARAFVRESDRIHFEPAAGDAPVYANAHDFVEKIRLYGYYGGTRLIQAAASMFFDYCSKNGVPLAAKNFAIRYDSDIPRQVGLGGSSAIIVAAMRGLMSFYEAEIPLEILPTLVLLAELRELGINAGFMDRVAQVYEGCVYMDLDKRFIEDRGHGEYERLDARLLPALYLAYKPQLGKVSGHLLNEIRVAYDRGDPFVIETLRKIAETAGRGREDFQRGDLSRWPALMNESFDLRSKIMRISDANMEMVRTARACGASANFAGSGGSIVGIYDGKAMFERLVTELELLQAVVLKPQIL